MSKKKNQNREINSNDASVDNLEDVPKENLNVAPEENSKDTSGDKIKKTKKKPKKKKTLKEVIFSWLDTGKTLLVIAMFAGIGVLVALGQYESDPKRVAEQYFGCLLTGSYEQMYEMVDIEESDFVNISMFKQYAESEKIYGSVTECKYKDPVTISDDEIMIQVKYELADVDTEAESQAEGQTQTEKDKKTGVYEIRLKKQKERAFLFFPLWKIDLDEQIIENCRITTPSYAKTSIDGVDLAEYATKTDENEEYTTYTIPKLLRGDHIFTAYEDFMENMNLAVYVEEHDAQYMIETKDVTMPKSNQEDIKEQGQNILIQMFSSAMDKTKKYSSVKKLFASDKQTQTIAKKCFTNLRNEVIREDGTVLSSLEFDSIKPYIVSYEYPNHAVLKIDYKFHYNAKKGDVFLSGLFEENVDTGKDSTIINFELINDKWVATNIDLECFPYEAEIIE